MATTGKNEGTNQEKLKRSKKLNPEVPKDDDEDDVPKGFKETSLKTKAGTARRTQERALGTPLPEEDDDEEDSVEEDDDAENREHDEIARSSKDYEEVEAKEKARYQRRL